MPYEQPRQRDWRRRGAATLILLRLAAAVLPWTRYKALGAGAESPQWPETAQIADDRIHDLDGPKSDHSRGDLAIVPIQPWLRRDALSSSPQERVSASLVPDA